MWNQTRSCLKMMMKTKSCQPRRREPNPRSSNARGHPRRRVRCLPSRRKLRGLPRRRKLLCLPSNSVLRILSRRRQRHIHPSRPGPGMTDPQHPVARSTSQLQPRTHQPPSRTAVGGLARFDDWWSDLKQWSVNSGYCGMAAL